MNADGGDRRRLTHTFAYELDWSPDGRKIAFNCSDQVYVVNADGTDLRVLTQDGYEQATRPGRRTAAGSRSRAAAAATTRSTS